jgi:hypothetical protein
MHTMQKESFQFGSLRLRKEPNGDVAIVRYDGQQWVLAVNNEALKPLLRQHLQNKGPGLYIPEPGLGTEAIFA